MKELILSKSDLKNLIDDILFRISRDDYYIVPRDKNDLFLYEFWMTDSKYKEILLRLSIDSFISYEFDLNLDKYGKGNIVKFLLKDYTLLDFTGVEQSIDLYIKMKLTKNRIPVISFHKNEPKEE